MKESYRAAHGNTHTQCGFKYSHLPFSRQMVDNFALVLGVSVCVRVCVHKGFLWLNKSMANLGEVFKSLLEDAAD